MHLIRDMDGSGVQVYSTTGLAPWQKKEMVNSTADSPTAKLAAAHTVEFGSRTKKKKKSKRCLFL